MTKRLALVFLLEHYDDLRGLTGSQNGYEGDGLTLLGHAETCTITRCTCWQQALSKLDAALYELKQEQPVHHAHLVARYRQAVTSRRQVWFRHGTWQVAENERVLVPDLDPGRTPPTKQYDAKLVSWRPWVDLLIVAQALDRLETLYHGEPQLPREAIAA